MITVLGLIQTSVELSEKTIDTYGADMRRSVVAMSECAVFNRVTDRTQRSIAYARGGVELDAFTQFSFPDISASMTAASTGAFNLNMGLPGPLVAEIHSVLCLENTVIPPIQGGLKRMSLLRKREDVSSEFFQAQWLELHALLVKRLPDVAGYRQQLVLDGPRDAEGHMMVDGVVELWFPSLDAIDAAFQSDAGHTLMAHAKEFIAEISTFLVEPHIL